MRSFDEILAISADRKGGVDAVLSPVSPPVPLSDLRTIPDDRWLAAMTRAIFQAGFNWKVVENMWPGFETAFKGFDVPACAMMDDVWFDQLCADTSIVRYPQKIQSVQQNAAYLQEIAVQHGGFGALVADWPRADFAGLLAHLKKDATRLGGTTGQYFLRSMGVDGYILSKDVVGRLVAEGVIDKAPTSKAAWAAVQAAFNVWADQSGRPLKEISRVLATSCG